MPRLSTSIRIAASSILLLSLAHITFWAILDYSIRFMGIEGSQFTILHLAIYLISAAGAAGLIVAIGILKAKNWARIAALALGALAALFSGFSVVVLCALILTTEASRWVGLPPEARSSLAKIALVYLCAFSLAVWWIILFSRPRIAAQFSTSTIHEVSLAPGKPSCPPPIALLAWLMIASGALSAFSWPLILGKIPAMLFTHIFSMQASQWIWGVNTLLFLACGVGLLRLHRWSYSGTIVLHAFWLASIFVSQLSPQYPHYLVILLNTLGATESFLSLGFAHTPHALEAALTAIPTALLIAGLFYYRPAFQKAAAETGR